MDAIGFTSLIMSHFPLKHKSPEAETLWMQSFYRQLKVFSPKVLEKAANDIVLATGKKSADRRRFPSLAECVSACAEAKRWLEAQERGGKFQFELDSKTGYAWTEERKRIANEALRISPLAKRALKEGWHLAFRDYVRTHGHPPKEEAEIRACIRSARDFDEAMANLAKEPPPAIHQSHREPDTWVKLGDVPGLHQALAKLGASMLKARDETAKIIKGEK